MPRRSPGEPRDFRTAPRREGPQWCIRRRPGARRMSTPAGPTRRLRTTGAAPAAAHARPTQLAAKAGRARCVRSSGRAETLAARRMRRPRRRGAGGRGQRAATGSSGGASARAPTVALAARSDACSSSAGEP
ncbi:hypothetical protein GQ55_2G164600 [Panicum hallii var. hallii]|uniref:Uncharacterized protein n=1 Tax=Panicum hallii var. hallii TaxID=1504633 RepID=A0A2T7EPY4_9POAL|nr:hypothetical protein GQ55_2G164600 [Panicum hallii var. hallii]